MSQKTICSCREDTSDMPFLSKKVTLIKGISRVKCSCSIRNIPGQSVNVTILWSPLKKLFWEKCIGNAVDSSDSILTQILMLDYHDFKLTCTSNTVVSMEPHGIWNNWQLLPRMHICSAALITNFCVHIASNIK